MELLFIRHGPTEWSEAGRIQGRRDVPLSSGARAALSARRVPGGIGAGCRWVSSPLRRARETARALGAEEIEIEPRITEMDWGDWEGTSLPALREALGEAMRVNEARGLDFETPAGGQPAAGAGAPPAVARGDRGGTPAGGCGFPQGGGAGPPRPRHRLGHEGEGAGPAPVGACPPVRGLAIGRATARRAQPRAGPARGRVSRMRSLAPLP